MTDLNKTERFYLAHCVLLLITFIAAIVVTFGLMYMARRRGDPARWSLTLIKVAAVFYCLFCLIDFASDTVYIAFSRMLRFAKEGEFDNTDLLVILLRTRIELGATARLADCMTIVFVFLAIVFLSFGANLVRKAEQDKHDRIIKIISYGFASVLAMIALAGWAIRVKVYLYYDIDDDDNFDIESEDEDQTVYLLNTSRKLDFAFVMISWTLSIATFTRSTQLWLPTRSDKHFFTPLSYLLICCFAWLLRSTYEVVYQLKFVNLRNSQENPHQPNYLEITEVVLDMWSIFVVICLMFALGIKKKRGLWSSAHTPSNPNPDGTEHIPLEDQEPSPPAYTSTPEESSHISNGTRPSHGQRPGVPHQQSSIGPRYGLGEDDDELVDALGLGGPTQQYRPSPGSGGASGGAGNSHSSGVGSSSSAMVPSGPADGYGIEPAAPRSPPPHDEAMGLYHQPDGRAPQSAPLPYPEKN